MQPHLRPDRMVVLINRCSAALYSGMVPGLIAGLYSRDELAVDLRQLCERAGVAFMAAEIQGLDPAQHLSAFGRAPFSPVRLAQSRCRSDQPRQRVRRPNQATGARPRFSEPANPPTTRSLFE
ncbi:MAG: hypothetical protein CM15mP116_00360 [Synechococcus sp.]|nr:MAG: hypothetical protein CM15mP116_00360 [Synechococcus sp.]